jgi:ring-1,2-phenylacetyl-CoA epoxidase subunit PaaB
VAEQRHSEERRQFRVYEIFVQKDHGSPHVWVGSVDAGSPEDALVLARESFLRRDPAVSLWAVEQGAIHRTDYADRDFFAQETDKRYRTLAGYSKANAERWRRYKRALLDLEQDFVRD